MKRVIPIHTVDAFSDVPFSGNPAAVCYLMASRTDGWMQKVAAEMNLAETAFFSHRDDGFSLRWFTPTVEVDLCGHATLATAHIIWQTELASPEETIRFFTRSGLLTARRNGEWIELDFPLDPPQDTALPDGIEAALGAKVINACKGKFDLLLEVESEQIVRNLNPDLAQLAKLPLRGVVVTAASSEPGVDFVSRFFAPAAGIPEDPVTGSAHCLLAPYWGAVLGKKEMTGYQASQRGGTVRVVIQGDRVLLLGKAFTVLQGVLRAEE